MPRPKSNKEAPCPAQRLALVVSHAQWMEDELYYDYGLDIKKELGTTLRQEINSIWGSETPTIQNAIQLISVYENKVKALYEKVRSRELGEQTSIFGR